MTKIIAPVQHHHQYVKHSVPQLRELLAKVCRVHGERYPYLYQNANCHSLSANLHSPLCG